MMSNNQIPLIVTQDEKLGKKTMDDTYKSVLVENKTSDADITLFIYCSWDLVCWLSYSSKIIKPGEKYLYRSEDSFKFELTAHGEKSKRKVILSPALWDKDMLFHVTGSVSDIVIDEKELSEFPQEKQICLGRQNMEKEISADYGRNLYEILKLDIKEVREEKEIEKQNEMTKKAYHREMLRWHPDKNPECGDLSICHEIIYAYGVLGDPASRARYNNEADFNNGWTSKSKWKTIFWSECNTKEQKKEFWKRIGLLALSAGLALGGFALTFATGATAEIVDIANAAVSVSEATMGQDIAMASIKGAGDGAISFVANAIDRKLVNKEDVTWKEVVGHGIAGALIGGLAGIVRGAVSEHESNHGTILLISEGAWRSKMILQYMINGDEGKKEEKEVIGNGGSITIPKEARNIEVRFQVQRFIATWCDVKKYDRINKSWCKPITAHVFKYKLPPIRTFTLAGSLYFEAVMHVRDKHWNDLVEMQ